MVSPTNSRSSLLLFQSLWFQERFSSVKKRAKLLQNQALKHFIILNGILTLHKFVFAEKSWQHDLLGNGKGGTPEPGRKRRFITYGKDKLRIHRTRIDRHILNLSKRSWITLPGDFHSILSEGCRTASLLAKFPQINHCLSSALRFGREGLSQNEKMNEQKQQFLLWAVQSHHGVSRRGLYPISLQASLNYPEVLQVLPLEGTIPEWQESNKLG